MHAGQFYLLRLPADKHFDKLCVDASVGIVDSDGGRCQTRMLVNEIAQVPSPFGDDQRAFRVNRVSMIVRLFQMFDRAVLTDRPYKRLLPVVPRNGKDM